MNATAEALAAGAPTFTPVPTPDLEPTVDALVRKALAAMPTPPVEYFPTYVDCELVVYSLGWRNKSAYEDIFRQCEGAPVVYATSQCFNGHHPTLKGFRSFVEEHLPYGFVVAAQEVMDKFVESTVWRIEMGLDPEMYPCTKPYLYPETGTEARLPILLASTAESGPTIYHAGAVRHNARLLTNDWFCIEPKKEQPPLIWYLHVGLGRSEGSGGESDG